MRLSGDGNGLKLLNEMVFYLPLDQAQRLLEMDGQVTELLLVLRRKGNCSPGSTRGRRIVEPGPGGHPIWP